MKCIELEIDIEQLTYLEESLSWSVAAAEKAIRDRPNDRRVRSKWRALVDLQFDIAEAKADMYEVEDED